MKMWQRQTSILTSILTLILLSVWIDPINAKAETNKTYWQQLQEASDRHFNGIDIDLGVEAGVSDFDKREPYGKISLSFPLLSGDERIKRRMEKNKFIEQGVNLIHEIEESDALIKHYQSYLKLVEKMGEEQGFKALESFVAVREKIILLKAKRKTALRKLEGYLK